MSSPGRTAPGSEERETLRWVDRLPLAARAPRPGSGDHHGDREPLQGRPLGLSGVRPESRLYLAILDAVDTPWLKAQYDPSNCIVAGEDPYELLERVLPRLATMQASDRTLQGGTIEDLRRMARSPARLRDDRAARRDRPGSERLRPHLREPRAGGLRRLGEHRGRRGADGGGGMANLRASVHFLRRKLARHFDGPAIGPRRDGERS